MKYIFREINVCVCYVKRCEVKVGFHSRAFTSKLLDVTNEVSTQKKKKGRRPKQGLKEQVNKLKGKK